MWMIQKRIGNIIVPPGSYPTKHEKVTVDYLAKALGVDILFIPPDRRANIRTPDIVMDGFYWEIKVPLVEARELLRTICETRCINHLI